MGGHRVIVERAAHVLGERPFLLAPLAQSVIAHEVLTRARLWVPAHLLLLLYLIRLSDNGRLLVFAAFAALLRAASATFL